METEINSASNSVCIFENKVKEVHEKSIRALSVMRGALNESERRDYNLRLASAMSLIQQYTHARIAAEAAQKRLDSDRNFYIQIVFFLFAALLTLPIIEYFFTLNFNFSHIIFFASLFLVPSFFVFTTTRIRDYIQLQVNEQSSRLYSHQWKALELDWALLSRHFTWQQGETAYGKGRASKQLLHEAEKQNLDFELKSILVARVSFNTWHNCMMVSTEAATWPNWGELLTSLRDAVKLP
jgi:hypothetical protein